MTASRPVRVRGVLFDLDGVLIDSARAWHAVICEQCAAARRPSLAQFMETFGQGPEADRADYFPDKTIAEVERAYERAFPNHLGAVELGAGAIELLDLLASRGIKRAIVTNTPRALAAQIIAQKGLDSRIDALAAAGDAQEKPSPELLLLALERIQLKAGDVLYVGDSETDRKAAMAAGVFMIGMNAPGDATLNDLRDIAAWAIG